MTSFSDVGAHFGRTTLGRAGSSLNGVVVIDPDGILGGRREVERYGLRHRVHGGREKGEISALRGEQHSLHGYALKIS